jgi:cell division septation protein DedD
MDATIRDLEKICELDEDAPQRKRFLLVMAGSVAIAAIFGTGYAVGRAGSVPCIAQDDPLAKVRAAAGVTPPGESEPEPTLDRTSLTFPKVLTDADSRPEVEAALAAAAAEQAHPAASATPPSSDIASSPSSSTSTLQPAPQPASNTGVDHAEGASGFTVQVMAYTDLGPARKLTSSLQARGHRSFITKATSQSGNVLWKVQVGPFTTEQQAKQYKAQLEQREGIANTSVVAHAQAERVSG